jgi:AraC-like DNA-binding protein
MATSRHSIAPIDTLSHAAQIDRVAHGITPAPPFVEVSTSWERCANTYGVDPSDREAPRILTHRELADIREPLGKLVSSAQEELDRLYAVVRHAGYALLFCDATGTAIEHRGDEADAERFEYWGAWLGGVWDEAIEGTNGIGTCVAEERPVTIHRGQHYRARHKDLSCSGAPVFGIDGKLTAVLDVSAIDPDLSDRAHALTGALTVTAARAIEERYFRDHFRRMWIVAVATPDNAAGGMLLAVDAGQRIVGADRNARKLLGLDDHQLDAGVGLWSLFERNLAAFRHRDGADIATRLAIADGGEPWPALVTPPEAAHGIGRFTTAGGTHARPRLDLLRVVTEVAPASQARGGLSPCVIRRLDEYVDAHLDGSVDLQALAGVAGLSIFHFARAFKRTTGKTPHSYLMEKRVRRAQKLLADTDISLSQVAFAAGFSDQSHLARHFRRLVGSSPGEYRRLQR